MTDKVQKEEERTHFYEFKALYLDFPQGEIDDDREEPDFLIKTDDSVIGIEHIEYIRGAEPGQQSGGSSLRKVEMGREEFVKVVQKYFETKHSELLIADFLWCSNKLPNRKDMNTLAEDAVRMIESELPLKPSSYKHIGPKKLENTPLEDYLSSITISKPAKLVRSYWQTNPEVSFTELRKDEIQNLVAGKEIKINSYLKNCDKVWLLIVANPEHISSVIDSPNRPMAYSFPTSFERIFLYDRLRQNIIFY